MTRRNRQLWTTAAIAIAFVALAGIAAWQLLGRSETYRPGEQMDAITAELVRALPADYPRVTFTDVTEEAGITYRHFNGARTSQLPEDMGSGAAWGDFDDDGWVDLAIANEVGPLSMPAAQQRTSPARTMLFKNNRDGTFTDVTDRAGIDVRGWAMAASWADYDNDGRLDLLITAYGHNVLYHNEGDGRFTDRSAVSGVGVPEGFWTGAAWGDYDRDGFLDLYVTGYVKYTTQLPRDVSGMVDVENPASINPASFAGERKLLFHNNRNGTFTERAVQAGVDNPTGRGLVATWMDVDGDGWTDLYVGNDISENFLFLNKRNGTFEDITHAAHVADYRSSMGIAVGDWNGDGRQDLFLTHWIAQGSALYDNVPPTAPPGGKAPPVMYMDESDRYGVGQVSLDFIGWGTSFIDYDLDGRLDLFVVNGSTLQRRDDPSRLGEMRSQLFWNRGFTEGFFEVSPVSGAFFASAYVGRGAAFADFDNDGDVDAFVTTNGGRPYLLRNDGGNRNHWLQIDARGTKGNRQAIGATVRVVAGGASQIRMLGVQASYLSQNSVIESFGLGATATADTVEITWPSGARQVHTAVTANQRLRIVEGEAIAASGRESVEQFWTLMRDATSKRTGGNPAAALAGYERALALDPRHADALYYAGSMHFELGAWSSAAAVAGVSNEGDTKTGAPVGVRRQKCDVLQALVDERAGADTRVAMRERYRRLDGVLAAARAR
ncbi:MAG: FG-GAP-like repeat-containing protein [Gemmatimonadetes bacterium]|nr:FG-GAP-like repeat-containing protein [Gemmatimonadota bacterium]